MATPELIEAMEIVFDLAQQNALDRDDAETFEQMDEARRQRKALERVRRFIQNIKVQLDENGDAQ